MPETQTAGPPIRKWSFSTLKKFERCPYSVYLERVERVPQPPIGDDPRHPLTRGKRVHQEIEDYIQGNAEPTHDMRRFRADIDALKERYEKGEVATEERWGFDPTWRPVSWNDPSCWAMVIADAQINPSTTEPLTVIDYKTGKRFGKEIAHTQQMQLYSLSALMRRPEVDVVRAELWYLDEGQKKTTTYTRAVLPGFERRWRERAEKLTNAIAFPPKPSLAACRYCPYSPNEAGNGACVFGAEAAVKKVTP